jgi:hypothetical protein
MKIVKSKLPSETKKPYVKDREIRTRQDKQLYASNEGVTNVLTRQLRPIAWSPSCAVSRANCEAFIRITTPI